MVRHQYLAATSVGLLESSFCSEVVEARGAARHVKSSQVINSHNAFCICAKSKQQKSKIKACAIYLLLSLLWLSPAGLIVCKYFSHGRNPTFRSPLSLSTCARGAIAILKRVIFACSQLPHAILFYEPCRPAVCYPEFAHKN